MLAGLASLPVEPYEAAQVDGASAWRQFWDLTLPFLKPVIAIALLLRMMDALRLFDLVFILTGGGPANATETLSFYIYKVALRFADIGYAAAISLVVLVGDGRLLDLVHQAHAYRRIEDWRPCCGDRRGPSLCYRGLAWLAILVALVHNRLPDLLAGQQLVQIRYRHLLGAAGVVRLYADPEELPCRVHRAAVSDLRA